MCPKESGGVVQVDAVEQSPCPAPSGVTMRVDITGSAAEDVDGGTVDVTVYEMGFPFYTVSYDLCKWVACPLQSGPVDIGVEVEVPAHLPAAKSTVQLRGTGGGAPLLRQDRAGYRGQRGRGPRLRRRGSLGSPRPRSEAPRRGGLGALVAVRPMEAVGVGDACNMRVKIMRTSQHWQWGRRGGKKYAERRREGPRRRRRVHASFLRAALAITGMRM